MGLFNVYLREGLRGISSTFLHKSANSQRHRNAFSIEKVPVWDHSRAEVAETATLSTFKFKLDLLWLIYPNLPNFEFKLG